MTRPAQRLSADRFAISKEHIRLHGLKSTQAEHHHGDPTREACGRIVGVEEDRIEALQTLVTKRLGFRSIGHEMELRGPWQKQ